MKKVISILLAIVLMLGLASTALASSVSISASKNTVTKGDTVDVKLTLDSSMSNVIQFEYSIYFNTDLYELQSSAVGTALADTQISALKGPDAKGSYYSISYLDTSSNGVTVNAGVIYTLTFKAKTTITSSVDSQFELVKVGVMDTTYQTISDGSVGTASVSVQVNTESTGGSEDITASVSAPKAVKNAAGTEFNAIVYASGWDSKEYKLIDCLVNVPAGIDVTSVTAGDRLAGGTVSYNKGEDNKLRIVYNDANNLTTITVSGTDKPIPMFTIGLKLTKAMTDASGTVSVGGMTFKLSSDSESDESMTTVLPAAEADNNGNTGSVTFTYTSDAVTVSASELFIGDGVDIIPDTKKGIVVKVYGLSDENAKLTYTKGEAEIEMLYSAEISALASCSAYVAIVDKTVDITDFASFDNFTAVIGTDAATVMFGDTNGDEIINAQDALNAINVWTRKTAVSSDKEYLAYNVNCDARINTFDALGIEEAFVNHTTVKIITKAAANA